MKLPTALGASFSSRRMTILPWEVSNIAYVPAGRLMRSPHGPSYTRAGKARHRGATSPFSFAISFFGRCDAGRARHTEKAASPPYALHGRDAGTYARNPLPSTSA